MKKNSKNKQINEIGILDPQGKNINPLNDKPYTEDYKKLGKVWSNFPAYEKAIDIINDIRANNVILIVAQTGSGKTVLVPKYLLHALNYEGKIAITLPKQIIAKSAAEFAAKTLDVKIGEHVGYQYKGSPSDAKSNKTQLLYATDGTIVARLLNDPILKDFDGVIIDEAHERKVQIDFLLFLLRETIKLRPEFKLIIMSATINTDIFISYFSEEIFKFKVLNIAGRTNYPIESIFLPQSLPYNSIIDKGYEIIIDLLNKDNIKNNTKDNAKDILFFITSANEAFDICKRLANDLNTLNDAQNIKKDNKGIKIKRKGDVFCVEVYAGMDPEKQKLAQDKVLYQSYKSDEKNYNIKLVVATNVAESSLTIDGIKYVIDCGYELNSSFDPELRARKLDRKMISHAQAKQRMGRSGRTEPGICYHLYTKDDFLNRMDKFPQPDIRTSDLTGECLRLLNLEKINTIDVLLDTLTKFIEPPKENYIRTSINTLIQLGLVENNKITKLGELVVNIDSSDVMLTIALIFSKIYKCSHEMSKIVAMIQIMKANMSSIFNKPKTQKDSNDFSAKLEKKYNNAINKFKHKYGDHLSLLNIYVKYIEKKRKYGNDKNKINSWCYKNFLQYNMLKKVEYHNKKVKDQLNKNINKLYPEFKSSDIDIEFRNDISELDIDDRVLTCLLIAYRLNTAAKKTDSNRYRTALSTKQKINITINSNSYLSESMPKHIFYSELFISMGKANFNIVSKIPKNILKILS